MRSLQSRILVVFLALLLAVLGVTVFTVRRATYRQTLARIQDELLHGRDVFNDKLVSRQRALWQVAETLTKDDALRQAIFTDPADEESLFVALNNHRVRTGAELALLVALDGRVLVDTLQPGNRNRAFPYPRLLSPERSFEREPVAVVLDGRAYQLVAAPYYVPVSAPQPALWLLLGRLLDDDAARELGNLAGLEVTFVEARAGQPRRVLSSSLSAAARQRLGTLGAALSQQPHGLRIGEQDYLTVAMPLRGAGSSVAGSGAAASPAAAPASVDSVLMRSTAQAVLDFRTLSGQVLWIALGSVLLAALGTALIARGITRPVRTLEQAARRLAAGDYAVDLPLSDRGEIGELAREFGRMQEGIRERESAIHHLAYHDDLTGLPNRNRFRVEVAEAIAAARRGHGRLAVALLDLDRFKDINDTLGHHVGDRLLMQVAKRLEAAAAERGLVVARLGGDEFGVLLPALAVRQAEQAVAELRELLSAALETEELRVELQASIGIALFPDHGGDPASLLRQAEVAMYGAKEKRLGLAFYDASQDRHSVQRLTLMGELRRAIEADALHLCYQPKVELASGAPVEVEALVRWRHARLGAVSPADFVPLAEQTGVIRALTRWVLRRALTEAAAWHRSGVPLGVAVNLSALDLHDRELPRRLAADLDAAGVRPRDHVLEVTESSVMADPEMARRVLAEVVATGVTVSIDDFGTGYSSLAQLRRLPVQELKVDRSFVLEMARSEEAVPIVRATIEMAHSLGLRVVAEGVESGAVAARLREMGCDLAQGHYFGEPVEAAELLRRLGTPRGVLRSMELA
ncbi:MAG TPA: EAL domain-containing protein [Thermoanaerobaculia bacterium]|nr:EAL domain-containing protein [Thermoanaerobaculia bacterium]